MSSFKFNWGAGGSEPPPMSHEARRLAELPETRTAKRESAQERRDNAMQVMLQTRPTLSHRSLSNVDREVVSRLIKSVDSEEQYIHAKIKLSGFNEKVAASKVEFNPLVQLKGVLKRKAQAEMGTELWNAFGMKGLLNDTLDTHTDFDAVWWNFYDFVQNKEWQGPEGQALKNNSQHTELNSLRTQVEQTSQLPERFGFLLAPNEVKLFEDETHMNQGGLSPEQLAFLDRMTQVLRDELPARYIPKDIDEKKQPMKLQSILFPGKEAHRADGFFGGESWERLKQTLNYEIFFDTVGMEDIQKNLFRTRPRVRLGEIKDPKIYDVYIQFFDDMTRKIENKFGRPSIEPPFMVLTNRRESIPFYKLEQPRKLQFLLFGNSNPDAIDGDFASKSWQALEVGLLRGYKSSFNPVPSQVIKLSNGQTTQEVFLRLQEIEKEEKNVGTKRKAEIVRQKQKLAALIQSDKRASKVLTKMFGKGMTQVDYVTYFEDVMNSNDQFGFYTMIGIGAGQAKEEGEASGNNLGLGVLYQVPFNNFSDLIPKALKNLFTREK